MKIPITGRKKCLIIVDVQETFILERNKYIISNIEKIIKNIDYDLIVFSIQHNFLNSLWIKQIGWKDLILKTEHPSNLLLNATKYKKFLIVNKITRSCFKSMENLYEILKVNNIEEIHIAGYESNDCVLATALEGFDLGFYTFVIEEAIETGLTASNNEKAISLLNYLKLTNNSNFVDSKKTEFKFI